jgi:hypothetical protein
MSWFLASKSGRMKDKDTRRVRFILIMVFKSSLRLGSGREKETFEQACEAIMISWKRKIVSKVLEVLEAVVFAVMKLGTNVLEGY